MNDRPELMRKRKRTITVNETTTFLSVKLRPEQMRRGWCADCRSDVFWIKVPDAIQWLVFSELQGKCVPHLSGDRVCLRWVTEHIKNKEQEL